MYAEDWVKPLMLLVGIVALLVVAGAGEVSTWEWWMLALLVLPGLPIVLAIAYAFLRPWRCRACRAWNYADSSVCRSCAEVNPRRSWECTSCGAANPTGASTCLDCSSPRS